MKKRILKSVLFIAIAYGFPWVASLGIRDANISATFLSCMAVFPTLGIVAGELIVEKKKCNFFHICFILAAFIMPLSIALHWNGCKAETLEVVAGSLFIALSLGLLAYCCLYERGKLYPFRGGKRLWLIIGGCVLFMMSTLVFLERKESIGFYGSIVSVLPSICFYIVPYFGEEYAWRGNLQPIFQERFGKRVGVLLLGVVWEVWHACVWIPIFCMDKCGMPVVEAEAIRMAVVVSFGILLGWLYMKTENVWLCALIHGLYNYCISGGELKARSTSNTHIGWIVFSIFCVSLLFTKEFRQDKHEKIEERRLSIS